MDIFNSVGKLSYQIIYAYRIYIHIQVFIRTNMWIIWRNIKVLLSQTCAPFLFVTITFLPNLVVEPSPVGLLEPVFYNINFKICILRKYKKHYINNNSLNFNLPTVVYRTKVSLFSIMASTANFSQYWAVIMAIVGCLELAIVGICLTIVTWTSCDCCLVKAPCSKFLTKLRDCNSAKWWATSSWSHPLSLKVKEFRNNRQIK